jgi:hypothetical protein
MVRGECYIMRHRLGGHNDFDDCMCKYTVNY